MVLLFNCFITNKSSTGGHWERMRSQGEIGVTQDRGNLREDNKIDITKYTLASLAKFYPWKRAIIKLQLDEDYYSKEISSKIGGGALDKLTERFGKTLMTGGYDYSLVLEDELVLHKTEIKMAPLETKLEN